MPQLYGNNFHFEEYMRISSYALGIVAHLGLVLGTLLLAIKPLRSLIRMFVYEPGQGPTGEAAAKGTLEYRAIAVADDITGGEKKKALARVRYHGGPYHYTGLLLAEAAMVLLENEDLVRELGGGLMTPACLGDKFVERLQRVNVEFESKMLP